MQAREPSSSKAGRGAATGAAQADPPPFRTLVIEMSVEEKGFHDGQEFLHRSGTGKKSIDIAGNRRRDVFRGTTSVLGGSPEEIASTLVFDGRTAYIIKTSGGKTAAAKEDLNAATGYDPVVWREGLLAMVAAVAGLQPQEQSFAGRPCRVFRSRDGSSSEWIWNGVLLKEEVRRADTTILEQAVRIEENADLEDSLFAAPSGVDFVEYRQTVAQSLVHDKPGPWTQPFHSRIF
jgi:hypothetical protein